MEHLVIGIAGASGSGTNKIIRELEQHFPDSSISISLENYFKEEDNLTEEQKAERNYDDPKMLDTKLLCQNIRDWKAGKSSKMPTFSFSEDWVGSRTAMTEQEAKRVIFVEGAHLLTDRNIRSLLDIKIYVDTDEDLRVIRRLKRDVYEFGCSLEYASKMYFAHVKPMYERFICPSRHFADLILIEDDEILKTTGLLLRHIKKRLAG